MTWSVRGFALIETDKRLSIIGEAADGFKAIELARASHPDVIIMDINMPNMNGIEATRIIKREYPDTFIIALSVNDDPHIINSMLEAGATTYLTKGGSFDELFTALDTIFQNS